MPRMWRPQGYHDPGNSGETDQARSFIQYSRGDCAAGTKPRWQRDRADDGPEPERIW